MKTEELVYNAFLKKFEDKSRRSIGVELEFPLLNMKKAPVDISVARGLMTYCLSHGFRTEAVDDENNNAFIINADGDVLSFDNSYNNFEFSMAKSENLLLVSDRFYKLYSLVQGYLSKHGHTLSGMGINPYKKYISSSLVPYEIYNLVRRYLARFSGGRFHKYADFPAYLSSIQTHLDIPINELPECLTMFARLDFLRAVLFSNAPAFSEVNMQDCVCFRDYLWENSGFGALANNTGKVDNSFESISDITEHILSRDIFYRKSGNGLELITPVNMRQYFDNSGSLDVDNYLSFKNVEITRRGTLEVRGDCTQPAEEAFVPAAFNLGVYINHNEVSELLNKFFRDNKISQTNTQLRNNYIYKRMLPADKKAVVKLAYSVIRLAEQGLISRKKGEEKLISPLYERAEDLTCPAIRRSRLLKQGNSIEDVIMLYSSIH